MINNIKKGIHMRSIPYLIEKMNTATTIEDIKTYEDRVISSILSSLCILGSIINLIVRIVWKDSFVEIVLLSLHIFVLGFTLDFITYHIKHNGIRILLMSLTITTLEVTVFFAYYYRIGPAVWSIVFLLLILSIIRLDRIMFTFVALTSVLLNNFLYFFMSDVAVETGQLYYVVQVNLFIAILIIGLLWNQIYKSRFLKSYDQYKETLEQKEQITALYEEVVATEEELREQNEKLVEYNNEIKDNEKRLNFMAYNDALTGLPNRKHIIEKLNFLIELAEANHTRFALTFVDLDGFKKINDSLGHHIGDEFLKAIGQSLRSVTNEHDSIARFGGDEFAILVQFIESDEALYEYLDQFRLALSKEIVIENHHLSVTASFGVAIYPDDAQKVVDLFRAADVAMYDAKKSGKDMIQFYKHEMKEDLLNKLSLEHDLKKAYETEEFYLEYQPQIALRENYSHGFEALIRWNSEKRGIVGPNDFIPILEETGLINQVGLWVLEKACLKVIELNEHFTEDFYVSVNISPIQLMQDSFISDVFEVIDRLDVNTKYIELEITENVLIHDKDAAILKLNLLREKGLKIALDDFGTGYASLNYLSILPLDVLKIDREFIWGIDSGNHNKKIIKSIIDIVHNLNISVVAEGVENNEQLNYLVEEQCDHIQGYLISRPISEENIYSFIQNK